MLADDKRDLHYVAKDCCKPIDFLSEVMIEPNFCCALQGVSKGVVAEKIFTSMHETGKQADFVLCVGDDRSDEHMFEIIGSAMTNGILSSNTSVFACTVGQKPSKAKYYLDDPSDVITMLDALADASDSPPSSDGEPGSP